VPVYASVSIVCCIGYPTGEISKGILETLLQNVHLLGKMGQFFLFGNKLGYFEGSAGWYNCALLKVVV
jgi:hypothetical protein